MCVLLKAFVSVYYSVDFHIQGEWEIYRCLVHARSCGNDVTVKLRSCDCMHGMCVNKQL